MTTKMTQSQQFDATITQIWTNNTKSNASDLAESLGATRTGLTASDPSDNPYIEWIFPDHSKIWITHSGNNLCY